MFEDLYRYSAICARHRAAPLAQERERYLQYRAEQGATASTLKLTATRLLWIAIKLNISPGTNITMDQIREAASWWTSKKRSFQLKKPHQTRQCFIGTAVAWLRYIDRLQPDQASQLLHESLIADYALWMKDEKELSPNTITASLGACRQFLTWYEKQKKPLTTVNSKDVTTFIVDTNTHGKWARRTVATNLGYLRNFFQYAADRGECCDIAKHIISPRIYSYENLPMGPCRKDVVRLVNSMQTDKRSDIRNLPMILLCAVYGFRAGEVAGLRLADIDWENDLIRVWRNKSRRWQRFTLIATVGNAILRYLKEVRPICNRKELFLSLRAPIRPITVDSLWSMISDRMESLDIHVPHRGAHSLRHAFACHLLDGKFSLKEIGDLMGHKKSTTTLIYAKVDIPVLRHVANLDMGEVL